FEKSRIARKLLASGNGRANIGDQILTIEKYNHPFGYQLVSKYQNQLFEFWKSIGLHTKVDEEGRIYPYSESSLSVLDCLMKKPLHILENYPIETISKINHKYYLNDVRGPFDYVVIATGSIASFIPKKQEGFYHHLENLNLKMKPLFPSLVGFKLNCNFQRLDGVRIKCRASLLQNDKCIYEEAGEVILKRDGISGICILNLSSKYARLENKSNCRISLDLFPDLNININSKEELVGLVHPKLVSYFQEDSLEEINIKLHHFSFPIVGVYDYEFAQVVSGGISLEEVNQSLQLIQDPNIFVGGELLDIDGMCGGYNLMFAFCSGLKIGEALCNIK
ncbi:MAG: NAD(P)/FAD-dependent oxidoreductase, partial [Anaeroplasmataceae bacterium]|nr:NAD(P)/FAD-dependent oxidoreductase [Anaeroplasmataceae bacterium]